MEGRLMRLRLPQLRTIAPIQPTLEMQGAGPHGDDEDGHDPELKHLTALAPVIKYAKNLPKLSKGATERLLQWANSPPSSVWEGHLPTLEDVRLYPNAKIVLLLIGSYRQA